MFFSTRHFIHIRTFASCLDCKTIEIYTEPKFSLPTIRYLDLVNQHRLQQTSRDVYRSTWFDLQFLPHFYPLDFPFERKFRSYTRVHAFRDYFTSTIQRRRNDDAPLRKSHKDHSATLFEENRDALFFHGSTTFALNTLAFFRQLQSRRWTRILLRKIV